MQENNKRCYHAILAKVRKRLAGLPDSSHLKGIFSLDRLDRLTQWIEQAPLTELKRNHWPPPFVYAFRHTLSDLRALDSDIDLVIQHSQQEKVSEIRQWLHHSYQDDRHSSQDARQWVSGLFEIFVKARFLKTPGIQVILDDPLPNGKKPDIRLEMGSRTFYLECSVLTDSDEDRDAWASYFTAHQGNFNIPFTRPGPYDPEDALGPGPYYDCVRFYDKVYDKLARDLNPQDSQMSDSCPNVLLLAAMQEFGFMGADDPGIGWALDELFAAQPRSGSIRAARDAEGHPAGRPDPESIGLIRWLDIKARLLCSGQRGGRPRLSWEQYDDSYQELLAAPCKIGGVMLFDRYSLESARINYNAHPQCRLSHQGIARLERILKSPPRWR